MARWLNVENDLKTLIYQTTGFQEGDENFAICVQFAMTNIKYHRFLSVDSHKVTKSINGILEKFEIHSQLDKKDCLQRLCEQFLSTPCFEGRDTGKTDTHYSLLMLLLSIGENPTHATYIEKPKILKAPVVDDFDWGAYLREGEETFSTIYADSDSESDYDPLSDEETVVTVGSKAMEIPESQEVDSRISTILSDATTFHVEEEPDPRESGMTWLTRNVTVQYWCGQNRPEDPESMENLKKDWERYREATDPLYSNQNNITMSEIQLLREVLWILGGATDSFVFVLHGEEYIVRENIYVQHLTDNSLESYLSSFAKYGSCVQRLLRFEEESICGSYDLSITDSNRLTCQTYQAFANAISNFIKSLRKELTQLEKRIIKQEQTMTLAMLHGDLSPWLKKTEVVHSVYIRGVREAGWLVNNCQRASHLLSVLFETVVEYDTLGQNASDIVELLIPLWIQTTKPYIEVIDEWITNGNLVDPRSEFILKRNEGVKSLDESFWETAFTIHVPADSTLRDGIQKSQHTVTDNSQSKRGTQSVDKSYASSHWAPEFLEPVILEVVLAGKSMEMLQDLGKLADVCGVTREKSLYMSFLESLQALLGTRPHDDFTEESPPELSMYPEQIDRQMKIKGIYDPLLKINFMDVFHSCNVRLQGPIDEEDQDSKMLNVLETERLHPINLVLRQCLYPHITHKYSRVCTRLVQILKEEYHLMDYLAAMRHFFLMEAGDTMFDFYSPIFDKIRLNSHWRDISTVNLILQEALQAHYPEETSRLYVSLEDLPKDRRPINITDCIELHFKVPWPVDVVISSKCQAIYNQIFTFLLQVKRAKYCLDELRFCDLEKDILPHNHSGTEFSRHLDEDMPRKGRTHRMHVLRMRLTYFVNSLHNYIMTRILHSTGIEFKQDLGKAKDLDQIIAVHNKYVNTIHERCLLHKMVKLLKQAVMNVLNLILNFQALWDEGIQEISLKTIEGMEIEFSRCILFLSTFLNNVTKRGSFPHCKLKKKKKISYICPYCRQTHSANFCKCLNDTDV
ncbi:gamma-tubulin complex component 5-like isoform X2 [Ostrea edulis]|uniref:gamma-tubulin complex component 5-like isoform X2 n=1 Tax=Ostrea edulis TaxID=37623 RepID=UPI0024AFEBEC|nr:gamma-tubulin complex component 5-like isoform X2 [Ostrea edulis]